MRKSERIRLLEMEMLRMQFQIEYLNTAVKLLLDENKVTGPDMDAGKWYDAKPVSYTHLTLPTILRV